MWSCPKCGERNENTFEVCWKCGTTPAGVEDPAFGQPSGTINCLRCDTPLDRVGTKTFHEGTNWGVLGELGELFVKRSRFDVYRCAHCGHVEFFLDGVGEHLRGERG